MLYAFAAQKHLESFESVQLHQKLDGNYVIKTVQEELKRITSNRLDKADEHDDSPADEGLIAELMVFNQKPHFKAQGCLNCGITSHFVSTCTRPISQKAAQMLLRAVKFNGGGGGKQRKDKGKGKYGKQRKGAANVAEAAAPAATTKATQPGKKKKNKKNKKVAAVAESVDEADDEEHVIDIDEHSSSSSDDSEEEG